MDEETTEKKVHPGKEKNALPLWRKFYSIKKGGKNWRASS